MLKQNPKIPLTVNGSKKADRSEAISLASDDNAIEGIFGLLKTAVSYRTESQIPNNTHQLDAYFRNFLIPLLHKADFATEILANPESRGNPILFAERCEAESLPTVLLYGHSDVTLGQSDGWLPWELTKKDGKWIGRGSADNKGQHLINIHAIQSLIEHTGQLGCNIKVLIESGEEIGSPGLTEFISEHKMKLAADVFVGSDGPRVSSSKPTIFLGSRGNINFEIKVKLRDVAHHSGNWGGILRDPGIILAHALAHVTTATGQLKVNTWKPENLGGADRQLLKSVDVLEADQNWGEPGLSAAESLYAWNNFAVLALQSGNPSNPINAIQPESSAFCQIRFVKGLDEEKILDNLRQHFKDGGFQDVEVLERPETRFRATRTDPENEWVKFARKSIEMTTAKEVTIIPSLGGSLPNVGFSEVLGIPTVWIPHSYPSCQQHAPGEHLLEDVVEESLRMMAGLFWDIGNLERAK